MSGQPQIPGMTVTQPAELDDMPLHILPRTRCDELGVCQNTGQCDRCDDGTGQQRTPPGALSPAQLDALFDEAKPPEAGNVWFVGDEPAAPMSSLDMIAVSVLMLISAATAVGALSWLWVSLSALLAGA